MEAAPNDSEEDFCSSMDEDESEDEWDDDVGATPSSTKHARGSGSGGGGKGSGAGGMKAKRPARKTAMAAVLSDGVLPCLPFKCESVFC